MRLDSMEKFFGSQGLASPIEIAGLPIHCPCFSLLLQVLLNMPPLNPNISTLLQLVLLCHAATLDIMPDVSVCFLVGSLHSPAAV